MCPGSRLGTESYLLLNRTKCMYERGGVNIIYNNIIVVIMKEEKEEEWK